MGSQNDPYAEAFVAAAGAQTPTRTRAAGGDSGVP